MGHKSNSSKFKSNLLDRGFRTNCVLTDLPNHSHSFVVSILPLRYFHFNCSDKSEKDDLVFQITFFLFIRDSSLEVLDIDNRMVEKRLLTHFKYLKTQNYQVDCLATHTSFNKTNFHINHPGFRALFLQLFSI